jgi:hypothetical protein
MIKKKVPLQRPMLVSFRGFSREVTLRLDPPFIFYTSAKLILNEFDRAKSAHTF